MSKKLILLFLIVLGGLLFSPMVSLAGSYKAEIEGNTRDITYDGLVPCGKNVLVDGQKFSDEFSVNTNICQNPDNCEMPCRFCHFFIMFEGVIDYLLMYIVFPLATLFLVIGGLMFITASENVSRIETAKKLMSSTVIGLLIIFSAWAIINLFFSVIGLSNFALTIWPQGWFVIDCPIILP